MNSLLSYTITERSTGEMVISMNFHGILRIGCTEEQEFIQEVVVELLGGKIREIENLEFMKRVLFSSFNRERTNIEVLLWN